MKVLIIGGTGYMGKITVEGLLDRGDDVTVFSRGTTRPHWWERVRHIQGDRNEYADFRAKLRGESFDAVIDTQAYGKDDVASAVETFRGMVGRAGSTRVGRYLMVSTGSVYLEGAVDFSRRCPYNESDVDWSSLDYTYPVGEDPYAVGKRHCEKWLHENCDMPYTIIRVPAVMGPEDPTGRMWWWVQRALDGGSVVIPAEMRGAFRTLYSADAAANFIRTLDAPQTIGQTYYVAMPEIMTVERWVGLIWRAAGNEEQIVYVPRSVIRRQEALRDYSAPLTRPVSNIHDLSYAENLLGIVSTPVEEWVESTVNWYREQYQGEDSEGYDSRRAELSLAGEWSEKYARLMNEF